MPDPYRESNHPALYYQGMLSDQRRMQRYCEAINAVVKPGDVVADLGTGLGVLAMIAVQAGAARVYAVDVRSHVLPVTRRIIAANGMDQTIVLLDGDATEVELPEPVDVIINELIGDFGTDENIHECVAAIARRYLRPGGLVLPSRMTTHIAGVSYAEEFRGVYGADFHGMDLREALTDAFDPDAVMVGMRLPPTELTSTATLESIDFGLDMPPRPDTVEARLEVPRDGELQGFVGYFHCELSPGVTLDNYPCYPGCHWVNWHWPVTPPRAVRRGQTVVGILSMPPRSLASCWKWDWSLVSGDEGAFGADGL